MFDVYGMVCMVYPLPFLMSLLYGMKPKSKIPM